MQLGYGLLSRVLLILVICVPLTSRAGRVDLFDGKTLTGWETPDQAMWRVEDGVIAAGDGTTKVPHNSFLFTAGEYADFEFRCDFKLTGDPTTGMINSGIQFRSERLENGHAKGYQADIGDPGWWGCIYDEHRRNRVIAQSNMADIQPVLKRNDWNTYVIRCEGPRSQLWINGVRTVDYTEPEASIPRKGRIAVQIHSGGKAQVYFRNLQIEEFKPLESPLAPGEQLQTFTVPEGFQVELVASEETGFPKPITVSFDAHGRMWGITATEYPVDANESPAQAKALWENGGKDRVVVFDQPLAPGPQTPRVFADGLAMPMGVLAWKDGVLVGHGPQILHLRDTDQDGKADAREVILDGFGVQDSHLMPHQFSFGPGGWVYMAQGAFNRSLVQAKDQPPVRFDYCKIGRFKPDGSRFEIAGTGLNNIWGWVLGREGQFWIQEANDIKYSVVPFQPGSNYPGIGNQKFKPYAPWNPAINSFTMGGTGLSGLARSNSLSGGFPAPWNDVMFVANPISRTLQAIRITTDSEGRYHTERLPDFLTSTDSWFRPIAITFGPDGCLYVVDWYNKIISHNEVPRKHPDRDRSRGRLWRVRHALQTPPPESPSLASLRNEELLPWFSSDSTWALQRVWQEVVERDARELAPALKQMVLKKDHRADTRIHALWALDALGLASPDLQVALSQEPNRNLRREAAAIRSFEPQVSFSEDSDAQVRAQAIRSLTRNASAQVSELLKYARPEITSAEPGSTPFERNFERYLVRAALETCPEALVAFLQSAAAGALPVESRLFATQALPQELAPVAFANVWKAVDRTPSDEEVILLVKGLDHPAAAPVVEELFASATRSPALLDALIRIRPRLGNLNGAPLARKALERLKADPAQRERVLRVATEFQIGEMKPEFLRQLREGGPDGENRTRLLQALARLDAMEELLGEAKTSEKDPERLKPVLLALGMARSIPPTELMLEWVRRCPEQLRTDLLESWSTTQNGSRLILGMLDQGLVTPERLDGEFLMRMHSLLPEDKRMNDLWAQESHRFPQALVLPGGNGDYLEAGIQLEGPFTVESWVRLETAGSNTDGILGKPGGADFNFFDGKFRVYGGPKSGDQVIATVDTAPGSWTHLAVTRDASGILKLFVNGEQNATSERAFPDTMPGLDIGRTTPSSRGTRGQLLAYRVWSRERSPEEIRKTLNRLLVPGAAGTEGLQVILPATAKAPLKGNARFQVVTDPPELLNEKEAAKVQQRFERMTRLADTGGDPAAGQAIFTAMCLSCHTVGGKGAGAAPPLDGSSHRSLDSLLFAIVTPNAAMEADYRAFRVLTRAGQTAEGFLVKQDDRGVTLRFMGGQDVFFPKEELQEAGFTHRSFMPEGLLDSLPDAQVADLLTYVRSLK